MAFDEQAPTANDRFKARSRAWFWGALAGAVLVHFLVLAFGPVFTIDDTDAPPRASAMKAMELIPLVIEPPAPPGATDQKPLMPEPPPHSVPEPELPPIPEITLAEIEEVIRRISLPTVRFADEPMFADIAPPPGPSTAEAAAEAAAFAHFRHVASRMAKPELRNRREVQSALDRSYPRTLQAAEIEGQTLFWLWIDEDGEVLRYQIKKSCGNKTLDEAATRVVRMMRFTPALSLGDPVAVIAAQPIRFRAR